MHPRENQVDATTVRTPYNERGKTPLD